MKLPSIDIVIVNWNAGEQLQACLESIAAAPHDTYELQRVVVVDNASSDGSADSLQLPGIALVVIRNGENRGFAAACNQGIRGSCAEFVLLLNPDTRLFPDSLSKCVAFFSRPEGSAVGILGPQLLDEAGRVARSCARFPCVAAFCAKVSKLNWAWPTVFRESFMTEWDHTCSRDVDQVMGAFFLFRGRLFEELGGFDERFFVYFEEVDFSFRALKAGWKSRYFAEAQAFHKGGGCSDQVKARRLFYSLQSRVLYGFKHFGIFKGVLLLLLTFFIEPVSRVGSAAARLSARVIVETVQGYTLLYRALPRILKTISSLEARSAVLGEESTV
jgi:N-acetylglucosaminyl-diphospho-decaprenol L-rhamnosyltransferase